MASMHDGEGSSSSVDRFVGQVLQLEPLTNLDFPEAALLREEQTQEKLYLRLFSDVSHPPPPRYQLRLLKELVSKIESTIEDWDQHEVHSELMSRLAELLASPLPSETDAAQQKSYVTYSISRPTESDSLFSHTPTSIAPLQIKLLESRNLISAAGTTGLRTWEAALHLGQYLCSKPSIVREKRILELGAGTGYLSILCAKHLQARQVIASDGSDEVVANLPNNFFLNALECPFSDLIRPMDLKWGHAILGTDEEHWNGGEPIDVVLGADITYDEAIIPALAATLEQLFDVNRSSELKVLIAATERNRQTFEAFLRVCKQRCFLVNEVNFPLPTKDQQQGPFYNDKVPIRICEILKPR